MIAATTNSSSAQPNFRVGDERLVRVTASAAKKVGALLTRQGRPNGVLRVAVVGGGCSGLQYKMDLQDGPANRDILVESAGIKVVVDPKSADRKSKRLNSSHRCISYAVFCLKEK